MQINPLYEVGEDVSYTAYNGKIMTNRVEAVYITVGQSVTRISNWVETSKSPVRVDITYKLANTPSGYLLTEDSIFKKEVNE